MESVKRGDLFGLFFGMHWHLKPSSYMRNILLFLKIHFPIIHCFNNGAGRAAVSVSPGNLLETENLRTLLVTWAPIY